MEQAQGLFNGFIYGIVISAPFYLLGLSFGGMIATEIAKKLNPVHAFLIQHAGLQATAMVLPNGR